MYITASVHAHVSPCFIKLAQINTHHSPTSRIQGFVEVGRIGGIENDDRATPSHAQRSAGDRERLAGRCLVSKRKGVYFDLSPT